MEFHHETGRVYVLGEDGSVLAQVAFPEAAGRADINHTFVDPSLRGQGVAGRLMEEAVSRLRAEGRKARATCSYAVKWFGEHPEHADLLK